VVILADNYALDKIAVCQRSIRSKTHCRQRYGDRAAKARQKSSTAKGLAHSSVTWSKSLHSAFAVLPMATLKIHFMFFRSFDKDHS